MRVFLFRGKMTDEECGFEKRIRQEACEEHRGCNECACACGACTVNPSFDPWITGNLMDTRDSVDNRLYIVKNNSLSNAAVYMQYQVIPESVGQYVGKEDANGKKIFTGDVLSVGGHPVAVQLRGTQFVALKRNGVPLSWMIATHGVVIGNMFDNPELFYGNSLAADPAKKGE